MISKRRLKDYWKQNLSDRADIQNEYREYSLSQTNRRSIHAQDTYHHNNMDRRLKNGGVHDRLGK